jgi:hypothetical protein
MGFYQERKRRAKKRPPIYIDPDASCGNQDNGQTGQAMPAGGKPKGRTKRKPKPKPKPKPTADTAPAAADSTTALIPLPDTRQTINTTPNLARSADIMGDVAHAFKVMGLVGEETNAKLTYLCVTSRLFPHPMSIVIRGLPGSGKTLVQQLAASLLPDGEYHELNGNTVASMFNRPDGEFVHKAVILGECEHDQSEGTFDNQRWLRQLVSEGKVSREKSMLVDGNFETIRQECRGPISLLQTSTAREIFIENLDRLHQLHTNKSKEQTRAVKLAIAARDNGYAPPNDKAIEAVRTEHHEFQYWLMKQPRTVVVPYAAYVVERLPDDMVETRRLVGRILTTIKVIAFLNCHRRQLDSDGRIVSTLDDYQAARDLLIEPLRTVLDVRCDWEAAGKLWDVTTKGKLWDVTAEGSQWHVPTNQVGAAVSEIIISQSTVKKELGLRHDYQASRLCHELVDAGLFKQMSESRGRVSNTFQWAVTERPAENNAFRPLPTVDEVAAAMGAGE